MLVKNTWCATSLRIGLGVVALLFLPAGTSVAADNEGEHRHHGAHVHGHGELSLAADDSHVRVYLKAPADNFLGFEHAPQNDDQVTAISALKMQLKEMGGLFQINDEAQCTLDNVSATMPDFAREEHSEHETEEHHDNEDERHPADVEVSYDLTCSAIQSLKSVTVKLFDLYPGFEEIDAVVLLGDKQSAQTLTPENVVLNLR